jgi:glycosyltransferase involved in cell wall biosynthesis
MKSFPGRLGIQQRVVPDYRVEFFDLLAESCEGGLGVFAGDVLPQESIPTSDTLKVAEYVKARNYHFRDIRSASYFLWQGELVHWLENWKPDVLIVEANPRYLSTNRGVDWMHARAKPVIGWGLGAPPIEKQNSIGDKFNRGIRNYLRRRLHNQIDAYIAYSHKGAREFREIKNPEKPVYVAANAVTRSPVGPAHERKLEFDGRPIVLYVGRIQARKRLDNLISACSELPEELQPELWIVGDGPDLEALKLYANDTYPKSEFKGRKSGDELANIFKKADLFVLPGTGGLAVQEALSYALPVIVAEGDGTQRDLVKPDNGWLIPSNDEDALLETLKLALSDPARLRQMGISSYQIVQSEVNIDQMVNTFVNAINNTTWTGWR